MKRFSTWVAAAAVLALVIVLVSGCTPPAQGSSPSEPQNGVSQQWVEVDGGRVQCVRLYTNGISCDWGRKQYSQ